MEKKQTAVQWYFEKQTELDNSFDEQEVDILEYIERKKEIQDQAKQMEKEQMIEFATDTHNLNYYKNKSFRKESEDYYNETYEETKN
jgi:hypothetical protein